MKKTLLIVATVLTSAISFGQTTVYTASNLTDFQSMSIIDVDGDAENWLVYDLNGAGFTFDSQGEILGSHSWDTVALTPDNWVVTPAINLTGYTSATLSWGRAAADATYPNENYSVYAVASTAANLGTALAAAAATPNFTETISVGDEFLTKSTDISSLAGQGEVYVAIRHHGCTDQYILFVDDIKVEASAGINENVISASVYPNPAKDVLNIKATEEVASIRVLTADGKVATTANGTSVNVADLSAGMYIYEATTVTGKIARGNFSKN